MGKKPKTKEKKDCIKFRNFKSTQKNISIKNKRIQKKKIRNLNPQFNLFNLSSCFIYESKQYKKYYFVLVNNNNMKPSNQDILFLKNQISNLKLLESSLKNANVISIPLAYANYFN